MAFELGPKSGKYLQQPRRLLGAGVKLHPQENHSAPETARPGGDFPEVLVVGQDGPAARLGFSYHLIVGRARTEISTRGHVVAGAAQGQDNLALHIVVGQQPREKAPPTTAASEPSASAA